MEVNPRLIPIFLQEAEVNLGILSDYFFRCAQSSQTREELKAAYRAAHTIKGTAQLVQFKGINRIAQHIESILEKHYLLISEVTRSEHEILQQVIKLLADIVAAAKKSGPEPQQLVDAALTLLDQMAPVTARPHQEARRHNYSENHPDLVALQARAAAQDPHDDPFAEDAMFPLGFPCNASLDSRPDNRPGVQPSIHAIATDPFAEDPDLAVLSEPLPTAEPVHATETTGPFKDPGFLALQQHQELVPQPAAKYQDDLDHGDDFMPESAPVTGLPEALNLTEPDDGPRRNYSCCAFELCGRKYHLPIGYMVEISNIGPLLPLPLAPAHVKGLVNLRGQVMPVIDMSVFHPGKETVGMTRRLVVARNRDEKIAFLAQGIPYLSEERIGEEIDLATFVDQHRLKRLSA
ncbi:MAG: chemotaxis protein CheW [Desulfuromonadales bacterium]|nr:chemotaxis protein CheW [Desulfuromonadales bacterium]